MDWYANTQGGVLKSPGGLKKDAGHHPEAKGERGFEVMELRYLGPREMSWESIKT